MMNSSLIMQFIDRISSIVGKGDLMSDFEVNFQYHGWNFYVIVGNFLYWKMSFIACVEDGYRVPTG